MCTTIEKNCLRCRANPRHTFCEDFNCNANPGGAWCPVVNLNPPHYRLANPVLRSSTKVNCTICNNTAVQI
ncbi:hypothetical protein K443DRAFT_574918 [Laccaria amethystina LaAM-08-1]|uniref:Uncharacterized protein n=1 Tax=Laccaria amethystina LaAM-08-1 TaxID=1095629 RepID=A0A0C9XZT2_9AGAR|nr:hypothetical protein K443DRAFT_574918 [Laccaria amethystina LaAM-08-1]